jgi:hypothetical protein
MLHAADEDSRAAAVHGAVDAPDTDWALGHLYRLLDHDPCQLPVIAAAHALPVVLARSSDSAHHAALDALDHLPRTLVAAPADGPTAWEGWRAEHTRTHCPYTLPQPHDPRERRADLVLAGRTARGEGWTVDGSVPEARLHSLGEAITHVVAAVRRHERVPHWDEEQRRREVRDLLDRAAELPADGEDRSDLLFDLTPGSTELTWLDRRNTDLALDGAIACCRDSDPARQDLGRHALRATLIAFDHGRGAELTELARELSRSTRGAAERVTGLETLNHLMVWNHLPKDDPEAVDSILDGLHHSEPAVRAASAHGTGVLSLDPGRQARTAESLADLLARDPGDQVRPNAAGALVARNWTEPRARDRAEEALTRHLDDTDPWVRAHVLKHRLQQNYADAWPRLLAELDDPCPHAATVALVSSFEWELDEAALAPHRGSLTQRLARLDAQGWSDQPTPSDEPPADARAHFLASALAAARS